MTYPSNNQELSALFAMSKVDASSKTKFVKTIGEALEKTGGDIRHAALSLGVGRSTLDRWIVADGMQGPLMQKLIEERKKAAARKRK